MHHVLTSKGVSAFVFETKDAGGYKGSVDIVFGYCPSRVQHSSQQTRATRKEALADALEDAREIIGLWPKDEWR